MGNGPSWMGSSLSVDVECTRTLSIASQDATKVKYRKPGEELESQPVETLCFSPDGQTILYASENHIRIVSAESGDLLCSLEGHVDRVSCCRFSPDGNLVVSAGDDLSLRIWDVSTASELAVILGHTSGITGCDWSPDASRLVSCSLDMTAKVWDCSQVKEPSELKVLPDHTDRVSSIRFSPCGGYIATTCYDKFVRLWQVDDDTATILLPPHKDWARTCAFSPDSVYLVSGGDDRTLMVWNVESSQLIRTLTGHEGWITACTWTSPRWGNYFVSCSRDATIRLWSPDSSWAIHKLKGTHSDSIVSVEMSSDGSRFVSGSFDGNVKMFSVKPKRRWSFERDDLSGVVGGSPSELVEEPGSSEGEARSTSNKGGNIRTRTRSVSLRPDPCMEAENVYCFGLPLLCT